MSEKSNNNLALIKEEDLSLAEGNILNKNQLQQILKKTPAKYVRKRPAKGGGEWDYVSGGYVKKCLNLMFGWDWDFEIIDQIIQFGEVVVKGRLTCRTGTKTIVKTQFGNKEIVFKTTVEKDEYGKTVMVDKKGRKVPKKISTDQPLSIGNDMKAAATDALKKCASEIGIAADVYNKEEFREIFISHEEPTIEKHSNTVEEQRILDWINNADTIEKLKQVEGGLTTQEHIQSYKEKLEILNKKRDV